MWRNSSNSYGLIHIIIHWLMALTIFGMFALGLWMVSLDYYHYWYHRAPDIHKSIGILLAMVLLLRLIWRFINPKVEPIGSQSMLTRRLAFIAHILLYVVLFCLVISGYLISTAIGKGVEVFGWFTVPATLSDVEGQADVAAEMHEWFAWTLVVIAVLHGLAAFKHHFVDKDNTLKRMLRPVRSNGGDN